MSKQAEQLILPTIQLLHPSLISERCGAEDDLIDCDDRRGHQKPSSASTELQSPFLHPHESNSSPLQATYSWLRIRTSSATMVGVTLLQRQFVRGPRIEGLRGDIIFPYQ